MKRIFLCIHFVFFVSLAFSQWYVPYEKKASAEFVAKLRAPDNAEFTYYLLEKDNLSIPILGGFGENGELGLYDQSTKMIYIYNRKTFKITKVYDFKIPKNIDVDNRFVVCNNDKVVLQEMGKKELCVYEINKGIIGVFYFPNYETDDIYYKQTMILHDVAFYFKEPGVVEWIENPIPIRDFKLGNLPKYLHTSVDLQHDYRLLKYGHTITIKSNGTVYIDDKLYTKYWQNVANASNFIENDIYSFRSGFTFLYETDFNIFWNSDGYIYCTDKKLNLLQVVKYYDLNELLNKKSNVLNSIQYEIVYFDDTGILGLAYGVITEGEGFESIITHTEINLIRIIPFWDKPQQ